MRCVRGGGGDAKIWLQPEVMVAGVSGIPPKALRELVNVVRAQREFLIDQWKEYFDE